MDRLNEAASEGDVAAVTQLLDRGADPNGLSENEFTPLNLAALMGHHEVVRLLLSRGADPNARNEDGQTHQDLASLREQGG